MPSELPLVRQMAILAEIAQLADNMAVYEDQLVAAGFSAFRPLSEATDSFCLEEEKKPHSRYNIEVAKVFIGTPSGIPGYLARQRPDAYRSAFVEELRAERDAENGIPFLKIPLEERWRQELDPCIRRRRRSFPNPAVQQPLWLVEMLQKRQKLRENESKVHSTGLGSGCGDTPIGWEQFWLTLMRTYIGPEGFSHDQKRSSPFNPVYSKLIGSYWALCFSLESSEDIRLKLQYGSENVEAHTNFRIDLSVRAPGKKAKRLVAPGVWADKMTIRYTELVHGFKWAYGSFANFDEWEAALKAYICLYQMVAKPIDDILNRALRHELPAN